MNNFWIQIMHQMQLELVLDQTTDQDGNANFTNFNKNADGTYKVYFFEEHASSQGVEIGSYKLIMMLPMKGSNGQDLTKSILYPKNKSRRRRPEKELVDDNGDPLPPRPAGAYGLWRKLDNKFITVQSFVIPSQIGDLVNGATSLHEIRIQRCGWPNRCEIRRNWSNRDW